ncbi:MAG TPA: sigma-70 family RNA polymerase sigma factor [Oligoflexia bacterium]|nr:sigma-70 family RNA polymerase sigma factor [Oligoflexia bacterium]HMP27791.1 sigma-70 family RNA polymerase sigma factor [Oligoflexia bacterium]
MKVAEQTKVKKNRFIQIAGNLPSKKGAVTNKGVFRKKFKNKIEEKTIILKDNLPYQKLILKYREKGYKLGASMLRKWNARLDRFELESVVHIALCEAAKRFNPAYGSSFVTFLYYHLKGHLIRAIEEAVKSQFINITELEDGANMSDDPNYYRRPRSSSEESLSALINEEIKNPEERLEQKELYQLAVKHGESLGPIEHGVIKRIYLCGEQLNKVAQELGYSRCHLSRVKREVLTSLREFLLRAVEVPSDSLLKAINQELSAKNRVFFKNSTKAKKQRDSTFSSQFKLVA